MITIHHIFGVDINIKKMDYHNYGNYASLMISLLSKRPQHYYQDGNGIKNEQVGFFRIYDHFMVKSIQLTEELEPFFLTIYHILGVNG